jgi:tetratricopeptide (TPR) repeat protein
MSLARLKTSHGIIAIAFQKSLQTPAMFEFERQFIFSLNRVFDFFTTIQFYDYAVSANRILLPVMAKESQKEKLDTICLEHDCRYILHGRLDGNAQEDHLESIDLQICVYDSIQSHHILKLSYSFNALEFNRKMGYTVCQTGGLRHISHWLVHQIALATTPQMNSLDLLTQLEQFEICKTSDEMGLLVEAVYIQNEGELEQKHRLLRELIQEAPKNFLARIEMGHLYKRLQQYQAAAISLEAAFLCFPEIGPHQKALLANEVAICHALINRVNDATNWWHKAIALDKRYVNPYINLGNFHESQGSIEQAKTYFLQVMEVAPQDIRVYMNLARLYSKQEDWARALSFYHKQLKLEPLNPWTTSNIANCYLQLNDTQKALSFYYQAIELDPDGEAGRCATEILSGLVSIQTTQFQ